MIKTLISLLSLAATVALFGLGGACVEASRMPHTATAPVHYGVNGASGAPSAQPVQYWRDRRERYEERDRISYRELERMAFDLQDSASRAHDRAREMFHDKNFQGSRKGADEALAAYKDLKDASRAFYDQVVKYHGDLGHVDEEYHRVVHEYHQARDRSTHYGFRVENNLDHVGVLLDQLSFIEHR